MENDFPQLDPLCEKVKELHGLDAVVVLYGSRARGEAHEFSDWDFLVLADFPDGQSRERPLRSCLKGLETDLQCLTPVEYETRLHAWADGKKGPEVNGLSPSKAETAMAASAIDGVCLLGDAHFNRFRELLNGWVQEGRVADPVLQRLVSIDDGLTAFQRLLLAELKAKFAKSAKVVFDAVKDGSVGESHLYNTLVSMAQPFVSRYPLIKGQGNFGSIDGVPAAAMRYTECRASQFLQFGHEVGDSISASKLRKAAKAIGKLAEQAEEKEVTAKDIRVVISKSTGEKKRNRFLPPIFPHMLASGTLGIVGIDSKIPPFALSGVVAALRLAIEDKDATDAELLDAIGQPDFPTGGILTNRDQVRSAIEEGHGSILLKAKLEVANAANGNEAVISIRNLPFGIHGYDLEEELAGALKDGKLPGVKAIANTSSWEDGFRIDLTLNDEARIQNVEQSILASPSASTEIAIDITVVRDGNAERISLPDLIRHDVKRRVKRLGKKPALKELNAIAELDSEPRRTSVL